MIAGLIWFGEEWCWP